MALDGLLDLLNLEVSEVAEVQASNHGVSGCNPVKPDGVSEVSPPPPSPVAATPDTPRNLTGYQPEPLKTGACTPDTPATPKTINAESESAILAWLAHIEETDRAMIAEVLKRCREDAGALAYFLGRAAETYEAFEERAAIMEFDAGLPRAEAERLAALDVGCFTCASFARPGLSGGYCGGRDDLPRAYGENHPLRRLPDDRGATCKEWRPI